VELWEENNLTKENKKYINTSNKIDNKNTKPRMFFRLNTTKTMDKIKKIYFDFL
jgi:hypothetical protein